jgi:hypothetical protein
MKEMWKWRKEKEIWSKERKVSERVREGKEGKSGKGEHVSLRAEEVEWPNRCEIKERKKEIKKSINYIEYVVEKCTPWRSIRTFDVNPCVS